MRWVILSAVVGCSAASEEPVAVDANVESGVVDSGVAMLDSAPPDAGDASIDVVDTSTPVTLEKEPNDGKLATDVNAFPIPGDATGAIDPADDLDILSVTLNAGDLWTWTVAGSGGMTPHLGISERGNKAPTMVATGATVAEQEHFVLEAETYFLIVRDARNVPMATSKHVGGPELTWRASARPLVRTPTPATFPTTLSGKLDKRSSIALYSFTGAKDLGFDIVLRAQRKSPASDMDSRMSLYEKTTKTWVLTNDDDVAAKTKDSHIGGILPISGDYVVIVENVSAVASDLSFDLAFTKR